MLQMPRVHLVLQRNTVCNKADLVTAVFLCPAGWSYQKKGLQTRREGNVTIYGIPYSEHSSFAELRDCVKRLRPKRIIPTVNCPDAASARAIVDRFADLMDLSRDKSRLDSYFGRTASAPAAAMAAADPGMRSQLSAGDARPHRTAQDCESRTVKQEYAVKSSVPAGQAWDHNGQHLDSLDWQHQSAAKRYGLTADTMSPNQIKWEEQEDKDCAGTAAWEGAPSSCSASPQSRFHEQSFKTEEDQCTEQVLPMRLQAAPEHAYSAPAVLSPPSRLTDTRPDPDDPQCASAGCGFTRQECSQPAGYGLLCHNQRPEMPVENTILAGQCSATEQELLQCSGATNEAGVSAEARGAVLSHRQGQQPACCPQQEVEVVSSLSPSLLDDVDVAEQSRILCAIHHDQRQQVYAKQCLTSKKRQMTLGAFVAPKRVK